MRRLSLRRPSSATIISLVALFFAMGGTAVAATGGDFILGKANTATSATSLSNTKGTALSLSSTSTTSPLTVGNSVQVPKLNASELDGQTSSDFLPVNGTAANSSELGGNPASGFIQGGGAISDGLQGLSNPSSALLVSSAGGSQIVAICGEGPPVDELFLENPSSGGLEATWWNKDGVSQVFIPGGGVGQELNGTPKSTYVVVVQVDQGSTIATYTVTASYNSTSNTCYFTGQVVTSNGL